MLIGSQTDFWLTSLSFNLMLLSLSLSLPLSPLHFSFFTLKSPSTICSVLSVCLIIVALWYTCLYKRQCFFCADRVSFSLFFFLFNSVFLICLNYFCLLERVTGSGTQLPAAAMPLHACF